jgi:hypothetical protein
VSVIRRSAFGEKGIVVGAIAAPRNGVRLHERLFAEGFALMRERIAAYGLLALACALSGAYAPMRGNLLQVFAAGNPAAVFKTAPINAIMIAALIAIFFVLPSALRKLEPSFRMTLWRGALTFVMLLCLGVATDLGYAAAVIPGIVLGVLLSQALIAALLGAGERGSIGDLGKAVASALRGSFALTREHFMTTLGVCLLSLTILGVPFLFGLIALLVLDTIQPLSLAFTAPALLMLFVYCECVRYVLIVRWYGRLSGAPFGMTRAA